MKRISLLFISFVVGYSFLYMTSIIYIHQAGLSLAKYDALPFWCCVLGLIFLVVAAIASANDVYVKEGILEEKLALANQAYSGVCNDRRSLESRNRELEHQISRNREDMRNKSEDLCKAKSEINRYENIVKELTAQISEKLPVKPSKK
jgi:hypothetical protein